MLTLHVKTALFDGSDVIDTTGEDGGMEECAPLSSEKVDASYAVVAGAVETGCAILDVGLDYVLDSYDNTTGLYLDPEVDVFCTSTS